MRDTIFEQSVVIAAPVEQVFAFCSSRRGFERHFPHEVRWESGPEEWGEGSELTFRFRYLRWWFNYRTRVAAWQRNRLFVDEMLAGPYRRFVHTHLFEPIEGGTRYTDRIVFRTGLGRLVDRTLALRQIKSTFRARHARLKAALEPMPRTPTNETTTR